MQACGERGLGEVGAGSVQSSSHSPSLPSTPGGVTLTRDPRHQPQWPQHPKCPQRLHIEAPRLPSGMQSISRPSRALLQEHAEQPNGGARYEEWAGVRLSHPFLSLSSPDKSTIGNANRLKIFLILAAKWEQFKAVASRSPEFNGLGMES